MLASFPCCPPDFSINGKYNKDIIRLTISLRNAHANFMLQSDGLSDNHFVTKHAMMFVQYCIGEES